ncbi:MAG: cyclic nucleotide-binding domain-containing protein [Acidimicrobiales bacterium]|nr:cyclic nucleotide-binding domain-containing protein [Acidimicrobiales bacterium]RZV44650.1 MAG: cyclic nucleotide-binding domain-containing protein [Acidimicrobiales bacterium]
MGLHHHENTKIARLHGMKMFEHSSKKALEHLAAAADEVIAPAGTVLFQEGHRYHEAYIISEGIAEMTVHGDKLVEIDAGHVVGELAMLEHSAATGTVVCKTDVHALAIPHNRFDEILHENPELTLVIAKQLADRVLLQDPHIDDLRFPDLNDEGVPHYH